MLREIITHPEMDFLHAKYILGLFYVAIFCTTIPHSLWNYCLSRAEASTCSLFLPDSAAHLDGARCPAAERAYDGRLYCRCGAIVFGVLYSTLGKEKNR